MREIVKEDKISIRLLEDCDKKLLLKWLNDERVLDYWEGRNAIFDLDRIEEDFYSDEACEMERAIIEYEGKSIGYIQMYEVGKELYKEYEYVNTGKKVYAFDLFIGETDYWNKGIGSKLLQMVKEYLKVFWLAEILIVDPHTDNLRAVHVYKKLGFKIIKELKSHEMHEGKLVDCYLMECSL